MQILFYYNIKHLLQFCVQGLEQWRAAHRVLILVPSHAYARRLDECLWAFPPLSFLPHCTSNSPHVSQTPIVIHADPQNLPTAWQGDILLNIAADISTHTLQSISSGYHYLIECVDQHAERKRTARQRFQQYRQCGHLPKSIDAMQHGHNFELPPPC